ncbi:PIN domain-containing protein [Desulfurococcus mucosus]|uniref:SSU processome protein Utp24 n=1 Tax=Desulfurococcus mucosus (strain ATCC 35584 / DSM 2162 / JCM 9187 / O7/1) TaxID=765177 RepID=E8R7G7_DESM0|nr:PIN domain-containing protein [Desulfurococcus mucosus]ADV65632.1 SSU processome protein Utp24 [Desulfurococcus mucosus DSM 2162]
MSQSRGVAVLLDTNMLLLMAEGIPLMDQIEEKLLAKPRYIVITPVLNELAKLASTGKPSVSRRARLALEIISRFCEVVEYQLKPGEKVDDAIVRYALENEAIVATSDRELRRRLREHGLPEIYLREESWRIDVEGVPSSY